MIVRCALVRGVAPEEDRLAARSPWGSRRALAWGPRTQDGALMWTIDVADGVAQIRLDRPEKRNALNAEFWWTFADAIDDLSDSGDARAAVLSGNGAAFCAGIDLEILATGALDASDPAGRQQFDHVIRKWQEPFNSLERARFPVVAAVHGACLGAGMALATACDLRVVSADAVMRVEEVNIGLMADIGTLSRLPSLLPYGVAHELGMFGLPLDPARSVSLGFASSLQPHEEAAKAEATRLATHVATRAPLAVQATKRNLAFARDHSVRESLDHTAVLQASIFSPADIMAAVMARSTGEAGTFIDPKSFRQPE